MSPSDGFLTQPQLKAAVSAGRIDTVITAIPDQFGRLMGKRMTGTTFVETVLNGGTQLHLRAAWRDPKWSSPMRTANIGRTCH